MPLMLVQPPHMNMVTKQATKKKKKKERGGEGVESEDTENRYTILCSLHLIVLGKFSSGEQSLKDMLFIMSVVSSIQKNSICD